MEDRLRKVVSNTKFRKVKKQKDEVEIDERFKRHVKNRQIIKKKILDKRGRIIEKRNELKEIYKINENVTDNESTTSENDITASEDEHSLESVKVESSEDGGTQMMTSSTISTSILAVTNMDWDKITAADIFVFLSTFTESQLLKSVKIYMSDVGKIELSREESEGPVMDIVTKDSTEENNEQKMNVIRKYIKKRAKYYYAIAEFAHEEAAINVYSNADGLEVEKSALHIELSFVPENIRFDDEAVDECREFPINYTPHRFVIKALAQTNADFDWDQLNSRRSEITLKHVFTEADFANIEKYDNLLAPPSDDEDIQKYSNLLLGKEEPEVSESLNSPISSESDSENVEMCAQSMAATFSDPFLTVKPSKEVKSRKNISVVESRLESTELLMMDPVNEIDRHFDYHEEVGKQTKVSKTRGNYVSHKLSPHDARLIDVEREIEMNDPRFADVCTSYNYALDPSSSKFKSTENMKKLLTMQTRKRKNNYK